MVQETGAIRKDDQRADPAPFGVGFGETLQQIADLDLARRARGSVVVYAILVVVTFMVARIHGDPLPLIAAVVLPLAFTLSLFRLAWVIDGFALYAEHHLLWRRVFDAGAILAALLWSVLSAAMIHGWGFSQGMSIFLVATTGLCAGAVNTLAPTLWLSRLYVMLIMLPLVVAPLFRAEQEMWILTVMSVIYSGFLWMQAGMANETYTQVHADRLLLQERARQLEEARSRAELALTAHERFLANISHEIRTPLNGALGMTALVLETDLSPEQREYLEIARSSGRTLLTLIDDILDLSKIEAGKLSLENTSFDLHRLVETTMRVFEVGHGGSELAIEHEIAEGVPRRVMGDPTRLQQILVNLVGNAVKFTEKGFVRLTLEPIDGLTGGACLVRFAVSDTGIGVPEAKRKQIFKAFAQADESTTRRFGGTGLGLAISSQLTRMMGGRLEIDDRPEGGSCFHFTLPLLAAAEERAADDTSATRCESSDLSQAPLARRILVAEDNPVNALVVSRTLERRGYEVTTAVNGVEALRLFRDEDFDLVLMDLQMPEMDGYDATAAIRGDEAGSARHIPIVALTAHAMPGEDRRCREAGMDGYLSKPIDVERLLSTIEKLIMRRHASV